MICPTTNEPAIRMWVAAFSHVAEPDTKPLPTVVPLEGCLICGGHLRPERWQTQDGILISGKWRCQTDPEHIVTKADHGPLVPGLERYW